MTLFRRALLTLMLCSVLAGCDLPRGAALSREVLEEQDSETPSFQVVQVTRAALPGLMAWPQPASSGGHGWIRAARGPESQIIRSGDRVTITIWDNQENSLLMPPGTRTVTLPEMLVSSSGTIFVPYIDNVLVRGQSQAEARSTVQAALARIAPEAQVQMVVESGQGNSVDVVTGVARPGAYPLPDRNTTILSVLAQAGGIAPGLRNPLVRLIRDGKTFEIRADRLFADGSMNTTLRGQDRILVEEDKRYFTAFGAAGSEKLVDFDKDRITALEALSMMGGLNDGRADPKGVLILREYEAAHLGRNGTGPDMPQVVFSFDLTSADGLFAARSFPVNPGDTVLASESPTVRITTILGLLGAGLGVVNTASVASNR